MQWLTFWDSFKSAVFHSDQLTGVDKFNYLKSLLHVRWRHLWEGWTSEPPYCCCIDGVSRNIWIQSISPPRVWRHHIQGQPLQSTLAWKKPRRLISELSRKRLQSLLRQLHQTPSRSTTWWSKKSEAVDHHEVWYRGDGSSLQLTISSCGQAAEGDHEGQSRVWCICQVWGSISQRMPIFRDFILNQSLSLTILRKPFLWCQCQNF